MTETAATPKALDLFTQEQLTSFLDLIRDGVGRHVAARRIGTTGTTMRRLAHPDRDPEFARQYEEAENEGRVFYEDRLRAEARSRALSGSDRMLEVELATHADEYRHLRRDRITHEGRIDVEHAIVLKLDAAVLDTWPREKLLAFREYLAELDGGVVDAEFRELPAPQPSEAA